MVTFRKSKKVGPIRFTVSKAGLSTSAGAGGARVSVNSKGEVRRTVGIPGSGVYDTKKIGGSSSGGGSKAAVGGQSGHRVEATVVIAAESRALLDGQADVAYLPVVEVDDVPYIASLAGVVPNQQGWARGNRDAILMPQGDAYRVLLLVQRTDNPRLFGKKDDDTPKATDVGRLGKREFTKWAPEFAGRMIQVVLYIDATPGMEHRLEVRFRPDLLEDEDTDSDVDAKPRIVPAPKKDIPAAAASPGWYPDPWQLVKLRWFDGTEWTSHTNDD